jgi:hypothetical protein
VPLTVATAENEIVLSLGGKLAQAGMPLTVDGTNASLNAPIRKALRYVGIVPADPITVVDADLARVPATRVEDYIESAKLEALYVIQGTMPNGFDQQIEQERQNLHQIMTDVAAMIADYQSRVPKLNLPKFAVGPPPATCRVPPALRSPSARWGYF